MALRSYTEHHERRPTARDDESRVDIAAGTREPPEPRESSEPADLAGIWRDLVEGKLRFEKALADEKRHYVLLARDSGAPRLNPNESAMLGRVFGGEQQKAVAYEEKIACSTASKWFTNGLKKLGLNRRSVPLPLVLAAQAAGNGVAAAVEARTHARRDGSARILLSVPKPAVGPTELTPTERLVATKLAEGESRWEIASARVKSAQTVACQLRGIYQKLDATGRYAVVQRGRELGWFADASAGASAPEGGRDARARKA
jgi:DNA-binding NarL/FixJ family response regulator